MNEDLCPWPMIFQGKQIRTMIDERDQSFWIHAGDLGAMLGLANIRQEFDRLLPAWKRGVSTTDSIGRAQEMIYLNELALYKLCFSSRKPEADAFTNRVAELVVKLRRGELELRPRAQGIAEHVGEPQQKLNSIAYNRQAFVEGGVEEVMRQNAKLCRFLSDKHLWPKQYKEWGKELGFPSKDRTSGQQVLRRLEPWSACACSLVKNLLQMGMPQEEAMIEAEKQKAFFARLLRYATPRELEQDQENT